MLIKARSATFAMRLDLLCTQPVQQVVFLDAGDAL